MPITLTSLSKFRAEPLVCFLFISFGLRVVSQQQLLQDKVCLSDSNDQEYCRGISEAPNDDRKYHVLTTYQVLATYRTVIGFMVATMVPLYLFVGAWCDRFVNGRRNSLLLIIGLNLLQTFSLVLNTIYMSWSPWVLIITSISIVEDMTSVTVLYSYITAITTHSERAQRLLLLQVIFLIGIAIGIFTSGFLMNMDMPFLQQLIPSQIHNTVLPFAISFALQIISFIWTFIFIRESPRPVEEVTDDQGTISTCNSSNVASATNEQLNDPVSSSSVIDSTSHDAADQSIRANGATMQSKLGKIFDLSLLKAVFDTAIKRRPEKMRLYMWLMILVLCLVAFPTFGAMNTLYPLTQVIYKWDSAIFTRFITASLVFKPLATLLITPVITKFWKLTDLQICLFGCICLYLGCWSVGTIVHPAGFILNVLLASCSVCSSISARSYLSKKIPRNEITKVYILIQLLESSIPSIGSIVFTAIINYSIQFYPTLCFHFSCGIVMLAILVVVFVDLATLPAEIAKEKLLAKSTATVCTSVGEESTSAFDERVERKQSLN